MSDCRSSCCVCPALLTRDLEQLYKVYVNLSVVIGRLHEERAKYLVCELVSPLPEGLQDIAHFLRYTSHTLSWSARYLRVCRTLHTFSGTPLTLIGGQPMVNVFFCVGFLSFLAHFQRKIYIFIQGLNL